MKKKTLKNDIIRMQSVEKLIAEKIMLVDARNFQVAMLSELWNMYFDEGKKKLCQNILTYCNVNNSFDGVTELTVTVESEFDTLDVIESVKGLGKYVIKGNPYLKDDVWNIDMILDNSTLLISIKDSSDNVEPYAYFKNGSIELIKSNIELNPWIPVGEKDAPLEILELKLENGNIVRGHFTDKVKTTNDVFKFINVTHYRNIT